MIARTQRLGEHPQLAGLDPAQPPQPAVLADRDLGKALMHIQRHRPHHHHDREPPSTSTTTDRGEAGQHDTYGFALDRRNRTSRRGDQISARARGPYARRPALSLSTPATPVPVAPTSRPRTTTPAS